MRRCAIEIHGWHWHWHCIAPPHEASLRRSGIAHIVNGYHGFTCTPCVSSTSRMSRTCLCLPSRQIGRVTSGLIDKAWHINNIIASSAQTIHALRILGSHGMQTESIHTIYRAVVIAKLTHTSSAWWGFTTATDRQRLEAVILRGIRSGLILQPVTFGWNCRRRWWQPVLSSSV